MATRAARQPKTSRIMILVSDAEKRGFEGEAEARGLSLSEYMRQAASTPPEAEELPREALQELLTMLRDSTARARRALDDLDAVRSDFAGRDDDHYRQKVIADLESRDIDWAAVGAGIDAIRAADAE